MPVVGAVITHIWQVRDGAGAPVSGLAGTMTAELKRYPGNVTAGEAVTILELGSSGDYQIQFTPTLAHLYHGRVVESSLFLEYHFEDAVQSEFAVAVPDNYAYCAISEVVAYAQVGAYSGSTTPTESQVLGFMSKRASQVYAALAAVMGNRAPGPAGFALVIDTSSDRGLALSFATAQANALGAAMDALEAAGAGEAPARSERVAELGQAFASALMGLESAALVYQGYSSQSATHISTGEMTIRDVTPQAEFLHFDESTRW